MNPRGVVGSVIRRRPWLREYAEDLLQDLEVARLEGGTEHEVLQAVWRRARVYERGFRRAIGAQGSGGTVATALPLDWVVDAAAPDEFHAAEVRLAVTSLVNYARREFTPLQAQRVAEGFRGEFTLRCSYSKLVQRLKEAA